MGEKRAEKKEMFHGLWYLRRHLVRSLRSAREWQRELQEMGYRVHIEKEPRGMYGVYTRGRATRRE